MSVQSYRCCSKREFTGSKTVLVPLILLKRMPGYTPAAGTGVGAGGMPMDRASPVARSQGAGSRRSSPQYFSACIIAYVFRLSSCREWEEDYFEGSFNFLREFATPLDELSSIDRRWRHPEDLVLRIRVCLKDLAQKSEAELISSRRFRELIIQILVSRRPNSIRTRRLVSARTDEAGANAREPGLRQHRVAELS